MENDHQRSFHDRKLPFDQNAPPQSSRPRERIAASIQADVTRDRAEGPLRITDRLLGRSSREYIQVLLDRMEEGGDFMYVYILSSISGTLYIGATNNLCQRIFEHKQKIKKGFSSQYHCTNLIYFEIHLDPGESIDREKQIKNWRREKKERLIRTLNPGWIDLSQFLPSIEISRLSGAVPPLGREETTTFTDSETRPRSG